ncbi:MAG TPA: DinB family protein, partial [Chitinophagaceae bacterium]|nr:DinB family protein [Chitinophagaceae bacterium]
PNQFLLLDKMNKEEIIRQLRANHQKFCVTVLSLTDEEFVSRANGKWTAGQQLDHIYRSVNALNQGLALPKFVIRLYVGKANRPSKTCEALIAKYKLRLGAGGKAAGRFLPREIDNKEKLFRKEKLITTIESLCKKVNRYKEMQLDYYILPHPLLGKLTIREMLYFTIYHVEHHQNLTVKNLGK